MERLYLRIEEVLKALGKSRAWLYKAIKDGRFPAPMHPQGGRAAYWRESDVKEWFDDADFEAVINEQYLCEACYARKLFEKNKRIIEKLQTLRVTQ